MSIFSYKDIKAIHYLRGRDPIESKGHNVLLHTGQIFMVFPNDSNAKIVHEWLKEGKIIQPPLPKNLLQKRDGLAYIKHNAFKIPDNKSTKVWRYMDFLKFVSLLQNKALHFTRGPYLRELDKKEGSLPTANLKLSPQERMRHMVSGNIYEWDQEMLNKMVNDLEKHHTEHGNSLYINCWCEKDVESILLWEKYGNVSGAIAIQTDIDRLTKCFGEYKDYDIRIGRIKYIDFENEPLDEAYLFNYYLHKREQFQDEREIRCILEDDNDIEILKNEPPLRDIIKTDYKNLTQGVDVPIDLKILIQKIYVSPETPSWTMDVIKNLLKLHKLDNLEVIKSTI